MKKQVGNDAWDRIMRVVEEANMTVNYFARHIGLPRGENLYQIKRGNNGISRDVAEKIHDAFPRFPVSWLMLGDVVHDGGVVDGEQVLTLPLYSDLMSMPLPPSEPIDEIFVIPSALAGGAEFAAICHNDAMPTPFYMNQTVFLLRKQPNDAEIQYERLHLIETRHRRILHVVCRGSNPNEFRLKNPIVNTYWPMYLDRSEVCSMWLVCGTYNGM